MNGRPERGPEAFAHTLSADDFDDPSATTPGWAQLNAPARPTARQHCLIMSFRIERPRRGEPTPPPGAAKTLRGW